MSTKRQNFFYRTSGELIVAGIMVNNVTSREEFLPRLCWEGDS